MTTTAIRSPLNWVGGKWYSRKYILPQFPDPASYEVYVEPCGGAAHILFAKEPHPKHLEVYNDRNQDLVRFWLAVRDYVHEMQQELVTLPFAEQVFHQYRTLLSDQVRTLTLREAQWASMWFYVKRSTFGGHPNAMHGWGYELKNNNKNNARGLRSATRWLSLASERLAHVQIHNWDFERVFQKYDSLKAFFYVDPPYIGTERYYSEGKDDALFTSKDHERLSIILNNTVGYVALSYYDHPHLEYLYPESRWRRVRWSSHKNVEGKKNQGKRQSSQEVLLCNYPDPATLTLSPSATPSLFSSIA